MDPSFFQRIFLQLYFMYFLVFQFSIILFFFSNVYWWLQSFCLRNGLGRQNFVSIFLRGLLEIRFTMRLGKASLYVKKMSLYLTTTFLKNIRVCNNIIYSCFFRHVYKCDYVKRCLNDTKTQKCCNIFNSSDEKSSQ